MRSVYGVIRASTIMPFRHGVPNNDTVRRLRQCFEFFLRVECLRRASSSGKSFDRAHYMLFARWATKPAQHKASSSREGGESRDNLAQDRALASDVYQRVQAMQAPG